jgi:hypothetical protein
VSVFTGKTDCKTVARAAGGSIDDQRNLCESRDGAYVCLQKKTKRQNKDVTPDDEVNFKYDIIRTRIDFFPSWIAMGFESNAFRW